MANVVDMRDVAMEFCDRNQRRLCARTHRFDDFVTGGIGSAGRGVLQLQLDRGESARLRIVALGDRVIHDAVHALFRQADAELAAEKIIDETGRVRHRARNEESQSQIEVESIEGEDRLRSSFHQIRVED